MITKWLEYTGDGVVGNEVVVGAKHCLYIYGWKAEFPNCADIGAGRGRFT
jgi:hypothetical protein